MESSEAVPTGKGGNQEARELSVCQTTEELKTWNLNERQQQLVDASGLGNLKYMGDLAINRTVLRVFCELWSKETNTARFHDFEMAPSLRDTAYILGIPIIGRAVTTGAVLNMSSEELLLQYLGRVPGSKDFRGSRVKLSWLHSKFSQLSEHPTDKEIACKTRAYLLYLIGATLFSDKDKGYVSPKYLPLLSDFEKVREYAWGAAALAHLYKALSTAVSSHSSARKRLFGSATLLMGWIYEYIPAMRPYMEDGPALVIPRVCRWTGCVISQPAKEASDIKKAFSQLRVSDVNWEPFKDMDPASISNICSAPDSICFSRTWLINFNVREVYLPDRFARQFGQEQHPLGDVGGFQRHQWNASVDWSLEYASEIKHFEQLTNATHPDHTTVPVTCNTTEDVFTPASTAREFPCLNLLTVVESIKKELPIIMRFLEQRSLPVEVATSFARIHKLLEDSHLKEGNAAVNARGEGTSELTAPLPPAIPWCEEAIIDTLHPHGSVPDEAVQNGSDRLALECCDKPTGEEEKEEQDGKAGDVPGTQGEEEASEGSEDSEEDGGHKRLKRPLRRSSRSCVQAKRFKNRGGKGSQASDPIVL